MSRKPSGIAGPARVKGSAEGQPTIEYVRIDWPQDQKAIERKILGYFQREFSKAGGTFLGVEDLGDKGLDFLLTLPGGKTYLELMEIVAPAVGERPHRQGPQAHTASEYADQAFDGVRRKIAKYGLKHKYPIHLLLYTTHEQYVPSPPGVEMLKIRFKKTQHPFENVFLVTPLAEDLTPLQIIFNKDHPVATVAEDTVKDQVWISLPSPAPLTSLADIHQ